jgi:hypothetical protein
MLLTLISLQGVNWKKEEAEEGTYQGRLGHHHPLRLLQTQRDEPYDAPRARGNHIERLGLHS